MRASEVQIAEVADFGDLDFEEESKQHYVNRAYPINATLAGTEVSMRSS